MSRAATPAVDSGGVGDHRDSYTIRPLHGGERDDFLRLVTGHRPGDRSTNWLRWKYDSTPDAGANRRYVATRGGELVAAAGFRTTTVRMDGRAFEAVHVDDVAVRPDDRDRGLPRRVIRRGLEDAAARGISLAIGCPTGSRPSPFVNEEGWRWVDCGETFVRIQRPSALLDSRVARLVTPVLRRGVTWVSGWRRAAMSMHRTIDPTPVDILSTEGVPAGTLAALADEGVTSRLHVRRSEAFYRWRFANPRTSHRTYMAYRHGSPVLAIVVGTTVIDDIRVSELADVVPLVGDGDRETLLTATLSIALDEHLDADLMIARGNAWPSDRLSAWGFLSDRGPPLSWLVPSTVIAVRPVDSNAGSPIDGHCGLDPGGWRVTGADLGGPRAGMFRR